VRSPLLGWPTNSRRSSGSNHRSPHELCYSSTQRFPKEYANNQTTPKTDFLCVLRRLILR